MRVAAQLGTQRAPVERLRGRGWPGTAHAGDEHTLAQQPAGEHELLVGVEAGQLARGEHLAAERRSSGPAQQSNGRVTVLSISLRAMCASSRDVRHRSPGRSRSRTCRVHLIGGSELGQRADRFRSGWHDQLGRPSRRRSRSAGTVSRCAAQGLDGRDAVGRQARPGQRGRRPSAATRAAPGRRCTARSRWSHELVRGCSGWIADGQVDRRLAERRGGVQIARAAGRARRRARAPCRSAAARRRGRRPRPCAGPTAGRPAGRRSPARGCASACVRPPAARTRRGRRSARRSPGSAAG